MSRDGEALNELRVGGAGLIKCDRPQSDLLRANGLLGIVEPQTVPAVS